MHKMSSSFAVKQFLLVALFLSVFFQYLVVRISNMNRAVVVMNIGNGGPTNVHDNTPFSLYVNNLQKYYESYVIHYVRQYSKRNAPIYINYDTSKTALDNGIKLYKTYTITKENILTIKGLDICSEDEGRCQICELSDFIRLFFYEASNKSSAESTLQYFTRSECFGPRVRKDFVEYELESLGQMISLALLTQTFINVKFCKNIAMQGQQNNDAIVDLIFGTSSSQFSLLSDFDQNQFNFYKTLIQEKNSYGGPYKLYDFSLNPNSKQIFLGESTDNLFDENGFEIIHYNVYNYPLIKAVTKMFVFPKISVAFDEVFGKTLVNTICASHSTSMDTSHYNYGYNIDFDQILGPVGEFVNFSNWRKHSSKSEVGEETIEAMFWDVLSTYDAYQIRTLFKHLTGIERLPNGGMQRLPKTTVVTVTQRSKIAPDIFSYDTANSTVYVRDDCHIDQLIHHVDLLLKKKYDKIK